MDAKVLLFDWGDTLMRVFPGRLGRMVDWSEVETTPGIADCLKELAGHYRIGVASNANDSNAGDVRVALARVNLDGYFPFIFTAHDLNLTKADPSYYYSIMGRIHASDPAIQITTPQEMVMIGDSYTGDVRSSKRAGLKAIWYNPQSEGAPVLPPEQDSEVTHFSQLPQALIDLTLPDLPRCSAWLNGQGLPANIIAHSRTVAAAAYLMAVWLRKTGVKVEPILTHRGGLLHDLDKLSSGEQNLPHGDYSAQLLAEQNQPRLAEIARQHVISTILDPNSAPRTWEEKLVYFADKITEGSTIVPLSVRLAALDRRYPDYRQSTQACKIPLEQLQGDICHLLDLSSDELLNRLTANIKTDV